MGDGGRHTVPNEKGLDELYSGRKIPMAKTISPREMFEVSESMFDAAGVPDEARQAYYWAFNQYIYTGFLTP